MRTPSGITEVGAPVSHSQRHAALVLGLDSHGLAIARALADCGFATFALEKSDSVPGFATNRVEKVFRVPSFDAQSLRQALPELRQALQEFDQIALLAVNDRQVEAVAQLRDELPPFFKVAWLHCADSILMLQRKDSLEAHCAAAGLNYPKSVVFNQDNIGDKTQLRFPVIIKPVRPLSSFKALIATDDENLRDLLKQYSADLPILAQEYIPGGDECLCFGALMLDKGRVVESMSGRKLASFPPARGQTTVAQTIVAPDVVTQTQRFFADLGLSGPVSVEFKRAPDGSLWVIEPTVGRTDFWAGLCIGAGLNLPQLEAQIALGQPLSAQPKIRDCVWYDTERAPLAYAQLALRTRHWRPYGARQYFCYAGHHDQKPFWRALRQQISTRLHRLLPG